MARATSKPTVLAVDDKGPNLLAIEALLTPEYNVVSVTSGPQAIARLQSGADIDVILLDVQMPGMDGFETARHIKRMEAARDIPIIFVTAVFNEDPHVRKGYEVGGVDYFAKPFDPDLLKLKVGVYATFRTRERILQARERQVRESEELLRVGRKLSSMLESLRVGILIADAEGRICQATEEVSRIFKATEPIEHDAYGELLGWWDGAGGMIKDHDGPLDRALRAQESSQSQPMELQCLDGSTVTVVASAAPLYGLDRNVVGAVLLVQDVTEQKKIEAALQERVARLIGTGIELEASATAGTP